MPCYQSTNLPSGVTTTGRTSYKTEVECNQACKDGACCEGTSCSVKPECQCQGTGKTYKGQGTTCTPNPCLCCCEFGVMLLDGPLDYTTCTAINNMKVSDCLVSPLVISVSGVTDASVPGDPSFPSFPYEPLSFANNSFTTYQRCADTGIIYDNPTNSLGAGLYIFSSQLSVYARFTPSYEFYGTSTNRCSNGSVRLIVKITLERIYKMGSYNMPYRLLYEGSHKGVCESLDSYSSVADMLAGKSVTMTCDGAFTYEGSPRVAYAAEPQTITVSFAANPLP